MLGDCVLLKAEGSNEEWVGIIMDFQDQEGEDEDMTASFLWFSTHKEIRNKQKKKEFLPASRYGCS
jgi:origin recognition complex subunit 1